MGGLRFSRRSEAGDLAAFLGRALQLDRLALVRLRGGAGTLTAYVRLPFGVTVSRTARAVGAPPDVTVAAADLLVAIDSRDWDLVRVPPARDSAWRGALPPATGWRLLDDVPVAVVRDLVRTGAETLRAARPKAGSALTEALLDHPALTVSGQGRTVALPLRVLSAASRMGFLGAGVPAGSAPQAEAAGAADAAEAAEAAEAAAARSDGTELAGRQGCTAGRGEARVVVSASGGWARVAAPFGSAYHQLAGRLPVRAR